MSQMEESTVLVLHYWVLFQENLAPLVQYVEIFYKEIVVSKKLLSLMIQKSKNEPKVESLCF